MITGFACTDAMLSGRAVHWHPRRTSHGDAERPRRQSLYGRAVGHDSVWIAWAASAVYSVPGAHYLAGLALLAKLGEPAATNVLAILGFNLIMFALVELPPIGFVLKPDRRRPLTREAQWLDSRPPADIDIDRGRSRRRLPPDLGAVRPRLNAGFT